MSAFAELIGALFALLVEVTINAAIFISHALMAVFNRDYRDKLRADWDKSGWQRFGIIAGILFYGGSAVIAVLVWGGLLASGAKEEPRQKKGDADIVIQWRSEDGTDIKVSGQFGKIVEKFKKSRGAGKVEEELPEKPQ